jgi:hypothetical protein
LKGIITNQSGYLRFDRIAASEYKVRIEMAVWKGMTIEKYLPENRGAMTTALLGVCRG